MTIAIAIDPTTRRIEERRLDDGARLRTDGDTAEIMDAEGRLLVRYRDGALEIAAPDRLTLAAKHIHIEGDESVTVGGAGARLRLDEDGAAIEATDARVRADRASLTSDRATVIAGRIESTASVVTQRVERLEIEATKIVERARDTFREARELLESRAGRVRTIVQGGFHLIADRTTMRSTEETSIDGKRILLG